MDFKPSDKQITSVLKSEKQFVIPRFQREYSWGKKENEEFYTDIIRNLVYEKGEIRSTEYFFGTLLLIGDFESNEKRMEVVDGQQRLTTITIFLSVLAKILNKFEEYDLAKKVFDNVIAEDNNNKKYAILKNESNQDFFANNIQSLREEYIESLTDEQDRIIEAKELFEKLLEESTLKERVKSYIELEMIDVSYLDFLKAVRDQLLYSKVVCITTEKEQYANMIFEILNAKGKKLASIDLIKNVIFEVLSDTEPSDVAKTKWNKVLANLSKGGKRIDFSIFYRHFWSSKYKRSSESKLYDNFKKTIKTEKRSYAKPYESFLDDMILESRNYSKILNPNLADYSNRQEYKFLVQSLIFFNEYVGVSQVRIPLLALYEAKFRDKSKLDMETFKIAIKILENFHFTYNMINSGRTNILEPIYNNFCINFRKAKTKEEYKKVIEEFLKNKLAEKVKTYEEFESNFISLNYISKSDDAKQNMKCKYILNKIENYYEKSDINQEFGTVEHVLPESKGYTSIGNLILLESNINQECNDLDYDKKLKKYNKSKFNWIKEFIEQYKKFDTTDIINRAKKLSRFYFENILCLEIPKVDVNSDTTRE